VSSVDQRFGGQTLVEPLRRVLVRPPDARSLVRWREHGWLAEPDVALAERQHERFRELLSSSGAEVVVDDSDPGGNPDAIYTCDPAIMSDRGALILRPGKPSRRSEASAMAEEVTRLGIPVAATMAAPATAEGGDLAWLDAGTLLVGRSYRTNAAGIGELAAALPEVGVEAFDLPHQQGPDACLHLMSVLSPLDVDLVVAYPPLVPIRLMGLLAERSVRIVAVPDDEFGTMGPNVLALAPRVALAVDGSPETARRMERAGVDVGVYEGSEISHKGEGGPTCLTRELLRAT
jgi:dimethylargininase